MEENSANQNIIQKTFRRIFFYILIFVLLISLTFFFVFKDQDLGSIFNIVNHANIVFVALGVALMIGYFCVEAWNIRSLLASFGNKISFLKSLKFTLIGFFFCSVTPGASGGQPIEIYYMSKEKIPAANATMALLVQICGIQISVMALGVIGMVAFPHILLNNGIMLMTLIGLAINGFALVVLLVCVFSRRLTQKVVNSGISVIKFFGYKKIEQKRASINKTLKQYSSCSKYILSHRKEFTISILRTLLQMALFYAIPICVYKALNLSGANLIELFFMQTILFMATSGLPLPGAVGASETIFLAIYSTIFGEELLSSALLINRGISFYWFVLVSLIVVFINAIRIKSQK